MMRFDVQKYLLGKEQWQEYYETMPTFSTLQSPAFTERIGRFLTEYTSQPYFFDFTDGTQVIWPMMQKSVGGMFYRFKAMPLGLYGRPVVLGKWTPEKGREILRNLLNFRSFELHYVEHPLYEPLDFLLPPGVQLEYRQTDTHLLALDDSWESIWKNVFPQRLRNKVRRAEKSNLIVRRSADRRDVEKFFDLYTLSTTRWGYSQPPYSLDFFTNLIDDDFEQAWLIVVNEGDSLLAGGIFIEEKDELLYWFGAMDIDARNKLPNHLMFATVIRMAIEKGIAFMNFGASGELDGVRKFKEMWHAKPHPYHELVFRNTAFSENLNRVTNFWERLSRR